LSQLHSLLPIIGDGLCSHTVFHHLNALTTFNNALAPNKQPYTTRS
jgi:hypothetical protein